MSSGHIAYHMEAQRRQHVLDKKHAALERMAREKVSENNSLMYNFDCIVDVVGLSHPRHPLNSSL